MKLQLLDIEEYIKTRKIKQIVSSRIHSGGARNLTDVGGLFSENIFGRIGSKLRKLTFGYIDLKCTIIHPQVFPILTSINTDLTKLIIKKQKYTITDKGLLFEDPAGRNGIRFFIENVDKIDLKKIARDNQKDAAKFILKNKDKILINKFLVLPAGVRDIQIVEKSGKTIRQFPEITMMYEKLIRQTHAIIDDISLLPDDLVNPIIDKIQQTTIEISTWIKQRMNGKYGLIRGGLLKKVVDYSARLIITPDPSVELGYVGMSWHVYLKLMEPFVIHQFKIDDKLRQLIQSFTGVKSLDNIELRRFINNVNGNPSSIVGELKDKLIEVAKELAKTKIITYKRDPAENRDNWTCSYVRIDDTGYILKLNPFDLCKNGGDFDGDAVSIFSVLTNEARKQALNSMNPRHTKSCWYPIADSNTLSYYISLDAMTAIYSATAK